MGSEMKKVAVLLAITGFLSGCRDYREDPLNGGPGVGDSFKRFIQAGNRIYAADAKGVNFYDLNSVGDVVNQGYLKLGSFGHSIHDVQEGPEGIYLLTGYALFILDPNGTDEIDALKDVSGCNEFTVTDSCFSFVNPVNRDDKACEFNGSYLTIVPREGNKWSYDREVIPSAMAADVLALDQEVVLVAGDKLKVYDVSGNKIQLIQTVDQSNVNRLWTLPGNQVLAARGGELIVYSWSSANSLLSEVVRL